MGEQSRQCGRFRRIAAAGCCGSPPFPGGGGVAVASPDRCTVSDPASYAECWSPVKTKPEGERLDFEKERICDRPGCESPLERFIPPGAKPRGLTFAKVQELELRWGGKLSGV